MKIAINKVKEDYYELGYFIVNKLYYFKMKKDEIITFIKNNDVNQVVANNLDFEFDEISNIVKYNLNDIEMRALIQSAKNGNKFIYLKITNFLEVYLVDNLNTSLIEITNLFAPNISNSHIENRLELFKRYEAVNSLYESVIKFKKFDLNTVKNGAINNDMASKILFNKIIDDLIIITKTYSEKYNLKLVVINVDIVKILKEAYEENNDKNIKFVFDRNNKRDNLRQLLKIKRR